MFATFMLAAAYLTRYRRTGAAADLAVFHRLLEQTAAAALGIAWVGHYERTRAVADLAVATRCLERALNLTSRDDALRPWLLAHLGFAFWVRHSHNGSLDDLDRAVTYSRQARAAATADHPARGLVERFHLALAPAA